MSWCIRCSAPRNIGDFGFMISRTVVYVWRLTRESTGGSGKFRDQSDQSRQSWPIPATSPPSYSTALRSSCSTTPASPSGRASTWRSGTTASPWPAPCCPRRRASRPSPTSPIRLVRLRPACGNPAVQAGAGPIRNPGNGEPECEGRRQHMPLCRSNRVPPA